MANEPPPDPGSVPTMSTGHRGLKTKYEPPSIGGTDSSSIKQRESAAKYPPIDPAELKLSIPVSVQPQDLAQDPLLTTLTRAQLGTRQVPYIAGIPLLARIGRGGMGAVYYGIHLRLGIEVAVKILPFHLAEQSPETIQRFSQEAQLSARIQSEHLVRVLDINEENGLFFLVMEYVYGESAGVYLKRLKRDGKRGLPETEAIKIAIAASKGLAAAHRAGVVHRDIKPDNILIPQRNDGSYDFDRAKVADLGLSRVENEDKGITVTQVAMGTPGYMAPEQSDDAKRVTKAADIYSMGACIYDLIAGHPPFHGKQIVQVLLDTQQKPHEPLRKIMPEVSVTLSATLDNCLVKQQYNRLPDGESLVEALGECLTKPFEIPSVVNQLKLAQTRGLDETMKPSSKMISQLGISGIPTPQPPDSKPVMSQQEAPLVALQGKAIAAEKPKSTEEDSIHYAPPHITSERPQQKVEPEKSGIGSVFLMLILLAGGGLAVFKFVLNKPEEKTPETSTSLHEPKLDSPKDLNPNPAPPELPPVSDSGDANYNAEVRDGLKAVTEKRWKEALDAFRRAILINPTAKTAREGIKSANFGQQMELGAAALTAKDWANATKAYQAALESKPDDADALNGLEKAKAKHE